MTEPISAESPTLFPGRVAIAGAWGYIGRKLLDAALALGSHILAFDPGPLPADVDLRCVQRITDAEEFYRQPADLFHLALHPAHRGLALDRLLARSLREPVAILLEKPMAAPEEPQQCARLCQQIAASQAALLFDFPELFHPMTAAIGDFLRGHRDVRITEALLQRSKDREADTPRNRKPMVTIQHQEAVHCLAFLTWCQAQAAGGLELAFAGGLRARAEASPYQPPNPEDYPYVVDGRCEYELNWGETRVRGLADFKRGAPWAKRRILRGTAAGKPFEIDVNYLDTERSLRINGVAYPELAAVDSYQAILSTFTAWQRTGRLKPQRSEPGGDFSGLPDSDFARITYQLSSMLWRASQFRQPLEVRNLAELLGLEAGFVKEITRFSRYSRV